MSQPRPEGIILELIERTKQAVRALDNMNYRRTKKILLSDPTGELSEGENSVVENDDDDDKSLAVSLLMDFYNVVVVVHERLRLSGKCDYHTTDRIQIMVLFDKFLLLWTSVLAF